MVKFYGGLTYHPENIQEDGTLVLRSSNIHNNQIVLKDTVHVSPEIVNTSNVNVNDIIVVVRNGSRKLIGKHARVLKAMPNTVIGAFMTGIRSQNSKFVNALFDGDIFQREIYKNLGATINQITIKSFKEMEFYIPQNHEKQIIGNLISQIDNLLALQQRKNILLYKLRKSLLSTLLTDKCTPKVRFKSFLEPLKKQKLGDMAPLRGGFAFKANNYVNTGIPIIRISNILSNGSIGGNFAYYSEQSDDSNYILFNGSALIAMSGATTGKTAILDLEKKKKVYQNQRVGYFTPTKNSDYSFIKAIIKSNYFLKQLNSIMVAGAQPNVSAVDIDNFTFYFPESKKEQKYIGNNFEIINKIILLQKNRVDKLKKLKRSLLQQLFI
ncbi:MAG: restriction endonuclease subunit S [Ligilactobacillus salivarius]|nr:restriction endonuclease subunit S [Ligilactobacillus salivarius]